VFASAQSSCWGVSPFDITLWDGHVVKISRFQLGRTGFSKEIHVGGKIWRDGVARDSDVRDF
jgi:hypothetical protein